VRNFEGKSAVDVARTMAAGGGSDSARAVLFMVMTAAGLDPLAADDTAEAEGTRVNKSSSGGGSRASETAVSADRASLLDDAPPGVQPSQEPEDLRYSTGEGVLWVIVRDGLLVTSVRSVDSVRHSPARRTPTHVERKPVSKRLRFVRRSIFGGEEEGSEEGAASRSGTPQQLERQQLERQQLQQGPQVEVFRTRREAEERVRAVHYPAAAKEAVGSGVPTYTASTPVRQLSGLVGTAGGAGAAWGSDRRRSASSASSGGGGATVPSPTGAPVNAFSAHNETSAADAPRPQFYTAFIDAAQLGVFRRSVPHYYPNGGAGTTHSTASTPAQLALSGVKRAGAADQEDPLWAQFKAERARGNSMQGSAPVLYQGDQEGDARYRGTSQSNRPARLMPKVPAASTTASSAIPVSLEAAQGEAAATGADSTTQGQQTAQPSQTVRSKEELAARRLELSTEVAGLQALIFERMCRLADLQEALRARSAAAAELSAAPDTVAPEAAGCGVDAGDAKEVVVGDGPSADSDVLIVLDEEEEESPPSADSSAEAVVGEAEEARERIEEGQPALEHVTEPEKLQTGQPNGNTGAVPEGDTPPIGVKPELEEASSAPTEPLSAGAEGNKVALEAATVEDYDEEDDAHSPMVPHFRPPALRLPLPASRAGSGRLDEASEEGAGEYVECTADDVTLGAVSVGLEGGADELMEGIVLSLQAELQEDGREGSQAQGEDGGEELRWVD
jgi:hypothetical protein